MTTEHVSVPRELLAYLKVTRDEMQDFSDIGHLSPKIGTLREWLKNVDALLSRAKPSEESAELRYAKSLATSMWEKHYAKDAPQWELCDDLYGVLSQIDNMLTGLQREKPSAPRVVTELVSIEDHNRLTTGPSPWTNTRVEKAAFNAARSVFGTSTSDDDARVYRTLQAYIFAASLPLAAVPDGWSLVGEVSSMPGTGGFTMAAFNADEVPVGTALYAAAPQPEKKG